MQLCVSLGSVFNNNNFTVNINVLLLQWEHSFMHRPRTKPRWLFLDDSGGSRPVSIGGPGWGWKRDKSIIQTKQCLQFQQFWLGTKLLRYFISAFPFRTKSSQEICHCIINADTLSGGGTGGSRLRVTGTLALIAPPPQNRPCWMNLWLRRQNMYLRQLWIPNGVSLSWTNYMSHNMSSEQMFFVDFSGFLLIEAVG